MSRTKLIWALVGLGFLDMVIPIPFFAIFLIVVVVRRPIWFLDYVRQLFAEKK